MSNDFLLFVDDIIVNVDAWLVKTENMTNYGFENRQEFNELIRTMAISGIVMATVAVIYFAFELWGTITNKDWVIIVSCSIRICIILELIWGTVILLILRKLARYASNFLALILILQHGTSKT